VPGSRPYKVDANSSVVAQNDCVPPLNMGFGRDPSGGRFETGDQPDILPLRGVFFFFFLSSHFGFPPQQNP